MPTSSNDPQNPNSRPEPNFAASNSPSDTPPESRENDPNFVSAEIPLPDFNHDKMANQTPEIATDTSAATSPGSDDSPASQGIAPETDSTSPKRVYMISPAEPDWSNFKLPPLDEPPPEEEAGSGWKTVWAVVREVGETIILTLIIFFLIQTVIRNFRVVGTSMTDNLHNGQYLIIDKFSYNRFTRETLGIGGPRRGDVVVFEPPNRPGEDYVKRIIGLPGEMVEIKAGQVLVNGQPLDESYQPRIGTYSMPPRAVPEDAVFVLGDNRNNSNDSHNWGSLPLENIVGRAWLSYWPPEDWGTIPRDEPTEATTLKNFLNELVPSASAESE